MKLKLVASSTELWSYLLRAIIWARAFEPEPKPAPALSQIDGHKKHGADEKHDRVVKISGGKNRKIKQRKKQCNKDFGIKKQ